MRITHLLASFIVFSLFSIPALAEQEPTSLLLPQSPYISNPNPALADVNRLYITVNSELRIYKPPHFPQIEQQVEKQIRTAFKDSDINIIETAVDENSPIGKVAKRRLDYVSGLRWRPGGVPEFRISIEFLNIPEANQYVYHLQSSFLKRSQLEDGPKANMISEVWKDEPVMRLVAAKDLTEAVLADVNMQARGFIGSWSVARAADKQSDVNQPRQQLRKVTVEKDTKPAKQQAVEAAFVASKNSQVFHKASCPSAKRISPNNLVSYATRDEAIAAGKKPCERCNP
jgi:hypothetical protein